MKKENIFNYPKLIKVIEYLYVSGENIVNDISKKTDVQYSYISKQIKLLKKLGLIKTQKEGRINIINLTKKGIEVGKRVFEIGEILKCQKY